MSVTPGPWKYGIRKDGSMWLSLGNPETRPHIQGDLHATKADANLIVAAPELLAAAVKALDECCDLIGTQAGDALIAAIAKATGATP